jgi:hypothetical protein
VPGCLLAPCRDLKPKPNFVTHTSVRATDTNHGFEDVISVQITGTEVQSAGESTRIFLFSVSRRRALVPVMEMGDVPVHIMWGREELNKA